MNIDDLIWVLTEEAGVSGETWKDTRNRDLIRRLSQGYSIRKPVDEEAVEDAIEDVGWIAFEEKDPEYPKARIEGAIKTAKELGILDPGYKFSWE